MNHPEGGIMPTTRTSVLQAIPPAPPTPGIVHADAVGDDDFAVTPIHFVKV